VKRPRDELTVGQWEFVEQALPDAYELARSLARRCSSLTESERASLAEDSLRRRVRNFDRAKGKKLIDFARRGIILDIIRANCARKQEWALHAALRATDRYEEGVEAPDVGAAFAETPEEKDVRARGMAEGMMSAAHYAHTVARTPEEEFSEREEFLEMQRAAEAVAEGASEILMLIYEHDMTWDEIAKALGIDPRQAQRIEQKALVRLRALIVARSKRK
jgi:RNA polymerase sigma factor (sigma-70 family)